MIEKLVLGGTGTGDFSFLSANLCSIIKSRYIYIYIFMLDNINIASVLSSVWFVAGVHWTPEK